MPRESNPSLGIWGHLRDLYEVDIDFQEAYRACKNPVEVDRESWMEYIYLTRWFNL